MKRIQLGMNGLWGADPKTQCQDNRIRPEDRAVHDWYRFVLSFPPHLVQTYVKRFGLTSTSCVLDPFCGTGTTLVECKKLGILSIGVEANPMTCFSSRVKIDWSLDPRELLDEAQQVAGRALQELEKEGISDLGGNDMSYPGGHKLLRVTPEEERLLLKDSISPLPLHKTLVLLEAIRTIRNDRIRDYQILALAKALVYGISNLEFGPEVGVGRKKHDVPVVATWLGYVQAMARDLQRVQAKEHLTPAVVVHQADARELNSVLEPNSIDAVITSPPYPNEKDYTRTTRLESVLLGFINSKEDLRLLKKGMLRSNTRGVYKADRDDEFVLGNTEIERIADEIEQRRIRLGKTSGFERQYARVTKLYFGGMVRHLSGLRDALRPGAQLAYVVGDQASYLRVMIRTGKLLAEIAQSLGYQVVGIDLFRTRLATATKAQLREEVLLLRWPGRGTVRGEGSS